MKEKSEILTLKINNITMNQIVNELVDLIRQGKEKQLIYTPNSEIAVRAFDDPDFSHLLNKADYLTPDGAGLLIAARLLGQPLRERVAGYDLMRQLLKEVADKEISVYFLGGKPGIVDSAVDNIKKELPELNMAGFHHGYLDENLKKEVIDKINNKSPDILFVGMGVPVQEKFLDTHFKQLNVQIGLTVGGSFDVLAGETKRAPVWMQKMYLEWFYRLLQEPKRFKRVLALPRFLLLVIKEKIDI